jgi:hypothetical protein
MPLVVVARVVQTVEYLPAQATWTRPLVAADALAFYAWKLVWPATLSIDYARRPARVMGMWGGAWPLVAALMVGTAAFWVWRRRAREPWLAAAGLVLVAGVAPVLGLSPFAFQYTSTVADHYLYLATLGPALAATWTLVRCRRRAVTGVAAVVVVTLAVRSNLQLTHWRTDRAAWTHATEADAQSFVAPANLAMNHAREAGVLADGSEAARRAGRQEEADRLGARSRAGYERAADLAERAVAINPEFADARRNAASYNFAIGRELRGVEHLEALLAIYAGRSGPTPADASGLRSYAAMTWAKLGRYDRAVAQYELLAATAKEYREFARQRLAEVRAKLREARVEVGDGER